MTKGILISLVIAKQIFVHLLSAIRYSKGDRLRHITGSLMTHTGLLINYAGFSGAFRNGLVADLPFADGTVKKVVFKFAHAGWNFSAGNDQTELEYDILTKRIDKADRIYFPQVYGKFTYKGMTVLILEYIENVGQYSPTDADWRTLDRLQKKYRFSDMHHGNYGGVSHIVITDVGL